MFLGEFALYNLYSFHTDLNLTRFIASDIEHLSKERS